MRAERLPLHKPWFDAREEQAMLDVLASTHVAGDGVKGRELERLLRESTGARGVLALNSCTAALEIAVAGRRSGPGDEVILPSFTFVSTANAVIKAGARPVFADIDPITLGLDPEDVARRITPQDARHPADALRGHVVRHGGARGDRDGAQPDRHRRRRARRQRGVRRPRARRRSARSARCRSTKRRISCAAKAARC